MSRWLAGVVDWVRWGFARKLAFLLCTVIDQRNAGI